MGLGSGSLGAIAVFLKPLVFEFGWSRGETSFAFLMSTAAMGLGGILMGYLSDRYTTRPIVLVGIVSLGVTYLLLSRQSTLWQFYLWSLLLGGLGTSAFDAPLLANLGSWFNRNKGLALGLATAIRSLGQGLVPFIAGLIIGGAGWRQAYLMIGIFVLLVMAPLALLIRTPPDQRQTATSGSPATQSGEPEFPVAPRIMLPWLGTASIFCCITMATIMIHVVALAQDRGLSTEQAGGVLLTLFLAAFAGRISYGRLSDHVGGLRAYFLASAVQTILVFWFTQLSTAAGFYSMAVVFGFGYSGVMTCLTICVREMLPFRIRGFSQGVVGFTAWVGMGLGGWQAGFFYDLTGSYTLSFAIAVLCGTANLTILGALWLFLGRRQEAVT